MTKYILKIQNIQRYIEKALSFLMFSVYNISAKNTNKRNKMKNNIKAVIFDLDGTLLNSLEDLADSVNAAMTKFSYPTHSIDAVCRFVGNGVAKLIERALPNGKENKDYEACLSYFKEHYALHMYDKTGPYENIPEMLDSLKSKGYKLAVVSNKFDAAVKELCKRYFDGYIEVAIGENEAEGIKKKPAPDTVIKALGMLGCTKDEAVYVGDSEVDVHTAKNSGMKCISVLWGFREKEFLESEGACIFANTAAELVEAIENL